MAHRSGTGPIELAVLQAAGTQAAASSYPYIGCVYLLPVIEEQTGLRPVTPTTPCSTSPDPGASPPPLPPGITLPPPGSPPVLYAWSSSGPDEEWVLPGTNPDVARDQLAGLDGITTEEPAAYPAPLATLLRTWTHQHRSEDITASLTTFRDAIQRDLQDEDD